jgi:hypothetical protein
MPGGYRTIAAAKWTSLSVFSALSRLLKSGNENVHTSCAFSKLTKAGFCGLWDGGETGIVFAANPLRKIAF